MKQSPCQIGDLHKEIKVSNRANYLVACRELSVVVSEHVKYAGALAAMVRKQPHWVQKIYDDTRLLTLYVYRRTGANTFEMV
jgi:hypothetical protein